VAWYPKRNRFYAAFSEMDETEQGDVFWGVPSLIARHPEVSDRFRLPLASLPAAEDLEAPSVSRVMDGIAVHDDPVIVMPHTCDFFGPEKGRRNRSRLVARIERLGGSDIAEPRLVRSGEGYYHTFFLPSWLDTGRDLDDMFVNFRHMTTIDAAFLSRRRRVARLQQAAVIALRRRIAHFFTDYAPAPAELSLAETLGGLIRDDRARLDVDTTLLEE
jgi:hypothetical protein